MASRSVSPLFSWPVVVVFALIGWVLMSDGAVAQIVVPVPGEANPTIDSCPDTGLTYRVVPCVRMILLAVADDMLDVTYDLLHDPIIAVLTLAVLVYGIRLTLGLVRDPASETIMFVLKISAMMFALEYFMAPTTSTGRSWLENIFYAMGGMLEIVSEIFAGEESLMECEALPAGADASDIVWVKVDCALGAAFGFGAGVTLMSGIVGAVIGAAFSNGSIGFMIFLGGFVVLTSLLFSIMRCAYIFISAYAILVFMFALMPLFLPMCLFKATASYCDKYIGKCVNYIFQPVFLVAFLGVWFVAIEVSIFTGQHSLAAVMFEEGPLVPGVDGYDAWTTRMAEFSEKNLGTCDVEPFSLNVQPAELQNNNFSQYNSSHWVYYNIPEYNADGVGGAMEVLPTTIQGLRASESGDLFNKSMSTIEGFLQFGATVPCLEFGEPTRVFLCVVRDWCDLLHLYDFVALCVGVGG